MKTTVKQMSYEQVMALPRPQHKMPRKPGLFWRCLIRVLTIFGLMGSGFHYETEGLEKIGKKEPCLILMNHTCFLDMEAAYKILFPRPLNIICSNDGFIGMGGLMNWLMRTIGCVSTQKYVSDLRLVQDMEYCFKKLKTSVLMYPEAGYSFDGTATTLPRKFGVILKKLDVPVIMIETKGIFSRNPLYNELQIRKNAKISAKAYLLYSREEIREALETGTGSAVRTSSTLTKQTFYEAQYLAQGVEITYLSILADHAGDYISPEWDEDRWKGEGHHFVIPSGLPVASKFYPLEQ